MKFAMAILFTAITTITCFGQHGGKAEPKRIEFAAGKSSTVLTGSLTNASEMEYVFAAKKGQHVTITNPSPGLFDFRVFSEEFDTETEFDSSRSYTFDVPATGDYSFFVRKKMVKTPRTARFQIGMTIR
ncbi:MAG: hypothetical protein ACRD43_02515 [Pyrinomonadaceae bacterium]